MREKRRGRKCAKRREFAIVNTFDTPLSHTYDTIQEQRDRAREEERKEEREKTRIRASEEMKTLTQRHRCANGSRSLLILVCLF